MIFSGPLPEGTDMDSLPAVFSWMTFQCLSKAVAGSGKIFPDLAIDLNGF